MADSIDKRDFREQCARSIVKSYNVHYISREELEAQKRMQKEQAKPDAKRMEAPGLSEMQKPAKSSGASGLNTIKDNVTKEQIEEILGERDRKHMETLRKLQ